MRKEKKSFSGILWMSRLLITLAALQLVLSMNSFLIGRVMTADDSGSESPLYLWLLLLNAITTLGMALAATRFFDHAPLRQMGWDKTGMGSELLNGLLLGIFSVSLLAATMSRAGAATLTPAGQLSFEWILMGFLILLAALAEEAFFRGYVQRNLQLRLGPVAGLLAAAGIFTLFHISNPGIHVSGILGVFCGGIILGIRYAYSGSLWLGIAFHACWNLLWGPVLGFKVSGTKTASLMETTTSGPDWITGGAFGPEASWMTITFLITAGFLLYRTWRHLPIQSKNRTNILFTRSRNVGK